MAKKSFSRVSEVSNTSHSLKKVDISPPPLVSNVINLERINLADRENWLRALETCKANENQSLDNLLDEIGKYQGQIDQALQTAQAQSTIYAYAIGSRLDIIEEFGLFNSKGYDNLTAFIKNGEIRRPDGTSITTRQVWAYRRVTRGLNEFLQLAESIRDGKAISPDLKAELANLGIKVQKDVIESFLNSYTESIASVLELGVSKLEQLYRLPKPVAHTGLLAGKLPLDQNILEVHDVSFSKLRKAISLHEKSDEKPSKKIKQSDVNKTLDKLEEIIDDINLLQLNKVQERRLKKLIKLLNLK